MEFNRQQLEDYLDNLLVEIYVCPTIANIEHLDKAIERVGNYIKVDDYKEIAIELRKEYL